MKFNKAIDESLVNPAAIRLVRKAVEAIGTNVEKNKIKSYIRNNLVKNKTHAEINDEFIDGAIDAIKSGKL